MQSSRQSDTNSEAARYGYGVNNTSYNINMNSLSGAGVGGGASFKVMMPDGRNSYREFMRGEGTKIVLNEGSKRGNRFVS